VKIEAPGLDAESGEGFVAIPAGRYSTRITNAELTTAKDGESQYIAWELEIFGHTPGEGDDDFNGRKLFVNTSLKQKALWNLKRLLVTAGVPSDGDSFSTEDALGLEMDVQVGIREFEGRERNEVQDYLPVTGA